jgi:NADPH:quinone reductase-like Zn-dependent oxidoreductase
VKAILVHELRGPDAASLADVSEPEGNHWLADGERLLIDVHAAAISFPDLLLSRGLYQHPLETPYICGGELGGIVIDALAGSGFSPMNGVPMETYLRGASASEESPDQVAAASVPAVARVPRDAGAGPTVGMMRALGRKPGRHSLAAASATRTRRGPARARLGV